VLGLAAVALVSLGAGLHDLGTKAISTDEAYSLERAREPLGSLWTNLVADHVPVYFAMLSATRRLTGDSEWGLRLPSVLAGLSAAICVWLIARALGRPRAGLLAGVAFAVSPFTISSIQVAKPEALELALATWSSYVLLLAWRRASRALWLTYAVLTLIGLYTFYYHVFVLVAQGLAIMCECWRTRALRRALVWLAAQCAIVALFLPWPLTHLVGRMYEVGLTHPVVLSGPEYALSTLNALLGGESTNAWSVLLRPSSTTLVGGLLSVLVACGIAFLGRHSGWRFGWGLVVSWLAVPLVGAYVLQLLFPGFQTRYVLAVMPPIALFAGLGLDALLSGHRPHQIASVAAAVAVGSGWLVADERLYGDPRYVNGGWRDAAMYYLSHHETGEVLVPDPAWQASALEYYLPPDSGLVADPQPPTSSLLSCLPEAPRRGVPGVWVAVATYAGAPDRVGSLLRTIAEPTSLGLDNGLVTLRHYRFVRASGDAGQSTVSASGWGDFIVAGGSGTALLSVPGATASATLCDSSLRDVDVTARVRADRPVRGGNSFMYVLERWINSGSYYLTRLRLSQDGSAWLQAGRSVDGAVEMLGGEVRVSSATSGDGAPAIWLRGQASGAEPTMLRLKAWPDGEPEPASWTLSVSDASSSLQVPGAVGLRAFVSAHATNTPVEVAFNGVRLRELPDST
jgi:hypothetical protein